MVYLLLLLLYAVRATTRSEPGTTSKASGPGCTGISVYETTYIQKPAYQIRYLAEVNLNAALVEVRVSRRVVNQLRQLALPHLRGAVAEHE